MKLVRKLGYVSVIAGALAISCTKKEETKTEGAGASDNMKNPVGALDLAAGFLSSMGGVIGGRTAALSGDAWTTDTHCNLDNGLPKWLSTDDPGLKRPGGGSDLSEASPRFAMQHLYCLMQADTKNSSTFVGNITGTKLYACFIPQNSLTFDGQTTTVEYLSDDIRQCWIDTEALDESTGEDELDEMMPLGQTFQIEITSSLNPTFGGEGWDAGIVVHAAGGYEEGGETIKILIKDSDNKFGIATLSNSGRSLPTSATVVGIDRATGELWYEGKQQRMRVTRESSSEGWNENTVGYAKGNLDGYEFTSVEDFFGMQAKMGHDENNTQSFTPSWGSLWTVAGNGGKDISYQYVLSGSNPNVASAWGARSAETTGSCNGEGPDASCGITGYEISEDAETGMFMHPDHSTYETSEDWFDSVSFPSFQSLTLGFKQQ